MLVAYLFAVAVPRIARGARWTLNAGPTAHSPIMRGWTAPCRHDLPQRGKPARIAWRTPAGLCSLRGRNGGNTMVLSRRCLAACCSPARGSPAYRARQHVSNETHPFDRPLSAWWRKRSPRAFVRPHHHRTARPTGCDGKPPGGRATLGAQALRTQARPDGYTITLFNLNILRQQFMTSPPPWDALTAKSRRPTLRLWQPPASRTPLLARADTVTCSSGVRMCTLTVLPWTSCCASQQPTPRHRAVRQSTEAPEARMIGVHAVSSSRTKRCASSRYSRPGAVAVSA